LLQPGETLGAVVAAPQQAQPQQTLQPGELPAERQITGISAAPKPQGAFGHIENYFRQVADDIRNGTDATEIGSLLKRAGAKGTNYGVPEKVGDYMGSPVLGTARVGQGVGELGQEGKRWQGTKDVVGGTLDAVQIPAAFAGGEGVEVGAAGAAKAVGKVGEAAEAAGKIIPSAKRAGETMEQLRAAIGTHPVEITDELSKAATRVQELADNGNTMPSAARKFIIRITDPEKGHLTYNEARDFMTKFGNMTGEEQSTIAPAMKGQMKQLGGALKNAVEATASRGGKLEDFQNSMNEYRRSVTLQKAMDIVKEYGTKAAITGAAGATGVAVYEKLKSLFE
jgi:hypothetical protein